jgi:hypothetical protein
MILIAIGDTPSFKKLTRPEVICAGNDQILAASITSTDSGTGGNNTCGSAAWEISFSVGMCL